MKLTYDNTNNKKLICDSNTPFLIKHKTGNGLYLLLDDMRSLAIGNITEQSINLSFCNNMGKSYFQDKDWELYEGSITLSN